ncbi:transcriptional regulator, GntR family [Methylobacterium sp. 4-46]|uniref:GntR family transcriptional regulator n=1 Tax=unclassified Methylobacterium TaxID=2615210 RepID=UPI000152EAAD|nr:GntR family transcriptional regulator [Methylobacterium sp. 4-46]ACA18986.1 transcriptional regulator, GntR family [Methylobacterium sp. 4-46]
MDGAIARIGRMERATLGDRVYAELRGLLIAGELAPGERLSLRRVAAELGTSMMPVREAVSRLAADRALEVLPNRSVRVPLMDAGQFRELTRVRVVVEGFAAEEAARARTEADLAAVALQDALFRAEARAASPNFERAVRANKDLHFAVYAAARMPTLLAIIEGLWLRVGPVLNLDMRVSGQRLAEGAAERHHAALVAAIRARDGAAARAALVADVEGAAAFIAGSGRLPEERRE